LLTHSRKYRADIDGLRAIAVLSVLVFHAFPKSFPGGFIGVDIFFVISGYLISGILFEEFDAGSFTYRRFYERRIRRIFPALFTVLVACIGLGWFWLFDREYSELGRQVVHGVAFIANFLFWQQSGYFDSAAATKPLLHLWSLGIEEQFYIVWPPILAACRRRRLSFLRVTVTVAALSFAANLVYLYYHSVGAFYSPVARFYELMIGSILAYRERAGLLKPTRWASTTGIILIAAGFLFIDEHRLFPGAWALLPTLGTYFLIAGGESGRVNRRLASPIVVGIGLISYPLYLWHWPLLSYAHILKGGEPAAAIRLIVVVISIALAWLTYRFIELPIRRRRGSSWIKPLVGAMVMTAIVGMLLLHGGGVPSRPVVANVQSLIKSSDGGGDRGYAVSGCGVGIEDATRFGYCLRDRRETPTVALIGDSKAHALANGMFRESSPGARVLLMAETNRVASPRESEAPRSILDNAADLLTENKHVDTAVIAVAMRSLFRLKTDVNIDDLPTSPHYADAKRELLGAVEKLSRARIKTVLVIDNPTLPASQTCIPRATGSAFLDRVFHTRRTKYCSIRLSRHRLLSQRYRDLLHEVRAAYPKTVGIFDPTLLYCDATADECPAVRDGRLLYSYSDHISDETSGRVAKDLFRFIQNFRD